MMSVRLWALMTSPSLSYTAWLRRSFWCDSQNDQRYSQAAEQQKMLNSKQVTRVQLKKCWQCQEYYLQGGHCYRVRHRLKLHANGRNNSQHCCANNSVSCYVRVGSSVQTDATTSNNVGTCSGIVGRIQPITVWKRCVMCVRGPNNVGRAVRRMQQCCTTLRWSWNKRSVGSCCLKRLGENPRLGENLLLIWFSWLVWRVRSSTSYPTDDLNLI